MGKYFITFSYLGRLYRGLQKNTIKDLHVMVNDPDTIQGALETAFSTILPKCIITPQLQLTSRTDCGVHALCNTAQIELKNKYDTLYNPEEMLKQINRYMAISNHDIRLLEFVPVKPEFHARNLTISRTYVYRFMVPKVENKKIPIMERLQCYYLRTNNFDIEKLKNGTKLFMGKKNFETFSARKKTDRKITFERSLNVLRIEKGQPLMPLDTLSQNFDYWNIVCSSKGFLYNQVKRIVSALLALACGQLTEKDITVMLQVPGHHNWPIKIQVVRGHALYLTNVEYCQETLDKYKIQYKKCPECDIVIPVEENEANI